MPEVIILADDLSGACEAAAAFLLRTTRIQVALSAAGGPGVSHRRGVRVLALDSDSRDTDEQTAATRVQDLLRAAGSGAAVVKKVDSLLRGHLGAELEAAATATGASPVVAVTLPSAARTVAGGVLHVAGVPLHETSLWHAEQDATPRSVAEALSTTPSRVVPLAVVRGARGELEAALAACAAEGVVPVCDAESDEDLDAVVAASRQALERPLFVGSAGLVAAVARTFEPDDLTEDAEQDGIEDSTAEDRNAHDRGDQDQPPGVLVAVGSAAPTIGAQLAAVRALADATVVLDPDVLVDNPSVTAEEARVLLAGAGLGLLVLDPGAAVRPEQSARIVDALATVVAAVAGRRSLVLAGGQTARAVLDALGVCHLEPFACADGAVTSRTDDGRVVITRPGSFGTPSSLAELTATLLSDTSSDRAPEGA